MPVLIDLTHSEKPKQSVTGIKLCMIITYLDNIMYILLCGGFFVACEDLGRMFNHSFPACTFLFLFLKWGLARTHWFHSLGQDQSTVAQRAEMTVAKYFLTGCM